MNVQYVMGVLGLDGMIIVYSQFMADIDRV